MGKPGEIYEMEQMDFISGPKAYDIWANNIERNDFDQYGNSYCLACYAECRNAAAVFFDRLDHRYKERIFNKEIVRLKKIFSVITSKLSSLHSRFPFPRSE